MLTALRAPPKIQFGVQASLFDSGLRQEKATLASTKADSPSLPEYKNLLLSAQKQLLELPSIIDVVIGTIRPDSTNCAGDHRDYIPNCRNQGSLTEGISWNLLPGRNLKGETV
jgi:hypothetical protein